jgi:serine protease Do
MPQRAYGFAALLAVMGVSIVFGMILGGRLSAPQVAFAAPGAERIELAPAVGGGSGADFADVVEHSMPAVVSVVSTSRSGDADAPNLFRDDPFFRRFWLFGDPEEQEDERQNPHNRQMGSGSGFIISPDGYVLTNNHVIEDYEKIEITTTEGATFDAQVVGVDPSIDLALLKIEPGEHEFPTLPLGDSDGLRVGEWVIAIGNPHEFDQTVTVGVVSGKERRVPLPSTDSGVVSFIQTDAAINLGNSGGPLLDSRGNVVGINTAIRRQNFAEGIGFALPINTARAVMQQLRERGEVRRGWIGIRMNEGGIDETARSYYKLPDTKGVLVTWVDPEGPASKAGLKPGDVIRSVDDEPVRDNLDMISKISSRQPGERVRLSVFREGQAMRLALTLGDREEGLVAERGDSGDPEEPPREEPAESSGLGITVGSLQDSVRERLRLAEGQRGVVITDVDFGSEADRKGLRPTMVVTAINDFPLDDVSDWEERLRPLQSGSPVKLDVVMPGGDQTFYFFLAVP